MRISDWSSDVCSSDLEIEGHYLLPLPFRGEGRGEGAVSRGRPIVRKVLTAPLPTLSPEGERAISIGQFQYPLGDDVELDLARPALDRIGLEIGRAHV